jgi:hypothetical protein
MGQNSTQVVETDPLTTVVNCPFLCRLDWPTNLAG